MRYFRRGIGIGIVAVLAIAGCSAGPADQVKGANAQRASEVAVPASAESSAAFGVVRWGVAVSSDRGVEIRGYDASAVVRSRLEFRALDSGTGVRSVEIRSVLQGPATMLFQVDASGQVVVERNDFADEADAARAMELANADLQRPTAGGLHSQALHTLSPPVRLTDDPTVLLCNSSRCSNDASGASQSCTGATITCNNCSDVTINAQTSCANSLNNVNAYCQGCGSGNTTST
jgi:hypothetical protein